MNIYDRILRRPEFAERPPVLLDIGAAGEIHRKWRRIAKYAVCIAFDADDRQMGYTLKEKSGYRRLYVYHCIAGERPDGKEDFYLTASPQCSSRLLPAQESLDRWAFAEQFLVERTTRLKAVDLPGVLDELGIAKVDWFKTDSQGTDVRLFKSLGTERIKRTLVAEFEPGIIDAYVGEDKLWSLLAYMDTLPFWMQSFTVRGSQRIHIEVARAKLTGLDRKLVRFLLPTSPGWGEVSYCNTFASDGSSLDKRDYLLGWVFAMIEGQYGFALEIALRGQRLHEDAVFREMETVSLKRVNRNYGMLPVRILRRTAERIGELLL